MKKLFILLFALGISISACTNTGDVKTFVNANGYTFSGDSLVTFTTMIIEDGKIKKVGGQELSDGASGEIIDLAGKTVLPGLIDAHGHVMGLGFQELNVNVAGIESLEATLDTIKAYAEANPELEWIQGRGWNQTLWEENEFPTAEDLDRVVPDRPVYLSRVDGHAGWVNSKALELAQISKDTPDPQGGKIIRDGNGEATGVFVDAAENYIMEIIPEPTEVERKRALEEALEQMASMGLTSVHDAGVSATNWEIYKEFADQGKMTTRIYAMIGGMTAFEELSQNGPVDSYANDRLALRSVKLYSDGALGSRGAAMIEPYSDDPGNRGLLFADQQEFNETMMTTASAGFQTNVHAIGDRANRVILNALEHVRDELGNQGLRHRIEHAQIVALEDIPRFAELDIIASMQPRHATSDKNMAVDRVGEDRIEGGYAWQTFLDQGTIVAAGSDFPVEPSNPFWGLYSSVTRMDHEGNPPGGWYPDESLSRAQALKAFTIDAAYAAHQEEVLGSIEEGKWADFVIIDQDYFEVPARDIYKVDILETWVAGEKVYSKAD
ncbi:MAG: amidohydrolase [Gracilimonas sp.]|uniref:amidohydrolase n=1 Tax=Gracilimonas sp. TaxID=1974203 RepID=UPI001B055436|nr:amidohydrolase [Gracilimonas sp.]MBO6585992.1 amidohydrolase [Gracilimonas sp.]MBO6616989.1 amidohydrolase [Gracilimonas sp.]